MPVAELHYEPGENDERMMRYMLDRLEDIAKAAARSNTSCRTIATRTASTAPPPGTCSAPAAWARRRRCRSSTNGTRAWDVPNLFIVDGSVFATGGVVNPTPTVCALALRAAEHIRDNFRELRSATQSLAA